MRIVLSRIKRLSRIDLLPLAATIDVALIGLASDGDLGVFVVLLVLLLLGLVTGRSGGGNGQDSGNDELLKMQVNGISELVRLLLFLDVSLIVFEVK